jgi:prepilin-type N-terminal cleavage/methylation domain-containing protein
MAHSLLRSFQRRFWRSQRCTTSKSKAGFTLAELLVTVAISSGIIAGLMYLVTELTSTNQREAARNETQRDMQNALDYIAADLRESVYVYTGECLQGVGGSEDNNYCPGILGSLPAALSNANSTPVLAFWKNELLPTEVRRRCSAGSVPVDASGNRANCSTGHAYTLVVYSLSTANPNETWNGRARITRYELAPFNSSAAPVTGYIAPATDSGGVPLFRIWPLDKDRLPRSAPRPTDTSAALVDFVDLELKGNQNFGERANPCPSADYKVTPSTAPFRSFYACVLEPVGQTNIGRESVDVLVHVRGNAYGKPGILNENSFLTGLETRVFSQSAVGKGPGSPTR